MPQHSTATAISSAGTRYLEMRTFKYFKRLKQGLKMENDQESDLYTVLPFLPNPKLKAIKYTW